MTISGFTAEGDEGARQREESPLLTPGMFLALTLCYAAGFVLMTLSAGPWQAVRDFVVEGLILFLWLLAVRRLLRDQPVIAAPVHRPRFELIAGLVTAALLIAGAALFYLGLLGSTGFNLTLIYLMPLIVLTRQPDPRLALGLRWPPRRAWLALLAVIAINIGLGASLGSLLPPGELPTPPGADLAENLTSPQQVLWLIGWLALVAAIPEELFFRVYLQPRLGRFLPVGWAILAQALLFSAAHLPQGLIRNGESWPIALAGLFTVANGVIGGCFWRRSRSLPLLIVLHIFAYPRFGL